MDDFSKEVELKFKTRFPEWIDFSGEAEYENEKVFEAKIPSPSKKYDDYLVVDTFNEEVTVYFDAYHAHFDDFGNNDAYDDALEFIEQLISNQCAIVSYWRDEKWCGSALVSQSELAKDNSEYPYANIVKIRTWLGTNDKVIHCVPKG